MKISFNSCLQFGHPGSFLERPTYGNWFCLKYLEKILNEHVLFEPVYEAWYDIENIHLKHYIQGFTWKRFCSKIYIM